MYVAVMHFVWQTLKVDASSCLTGCVMTFNGILKVAKMHLWNVSQVNIEVYFCRGGHDELK